jgi:hypothetical protein
MQIAILVMMYNQAQEGLYCPIKHDQTHQSAFDLFHSLQGTKMSIVKHYKLYEPHLRHLVPNYRVIPIQEEDSSFISIPGFIIEWKSKDKAY